LNVINFIEEVAVMLDYYYYREPLLMSPFHPVEFDYTYAMYPQKILYKPLKRISPYSYGKVNTSTGIILHYIKTSPNYITLSRNDAGTVAQSGYYGINGGYFDWNGDILSIAVVNNIPIKKKVGDYGSGWYNVWSTSPKRGTLVWDPIASSYSIQVINSAGNINVTNKSNYWAQGGISMGLRNSNWYYQAVNVEGMSNPDGKAYRTGIVYNNMKNIWLIVTNTSCTASDFRQGIWNNIGSGSLVDGIFLDGSGSSQMNCAEVKLNGDSRAIPGMVRLK
jgi:hypothetical protein